MLMMDCSKLIKEAEELYQEGNHGEAVARLTSAAKSNPSESEIGAIESLMNKIGEHVLSTDGSQNGSREIGGAERGLGSQLASSFFQPSGSSHAQLGKLALLGTLLAGNQKSSGGFSMQSALSMLNGHQQSAGGGSSGWASLASKFFGNGQGQNHVQGQGFSQADYNNGQQYQDTSTFAKLSSLGSSYISSYSHGGQSQGQNQNQALAQNEYNNASGYEGQQQNQGTSAFSKLSALGSSYLASHSQGSQGEYQSGYSHQQGVYGNQEGRHGYGSNNEYGQQEGVYGQAQGAFGSSNYGGQNSFAGQGNGNYGNQGQVQHQSKLEAIASMASNYMGGQQSNHASGQSQGQGQGQNQGQFYGEGHNGGLSSLASVASNFLGQGHGNSQGPPTAYGNPNQGSNGVDFTGGSHMAPL